METRSNPANIRDVTDLTEEELDALTEEELEEYLAQTNKNCDNLLSHMQQLDEQKVVLKNRLAEGARRITELDAELAEISNEKTRLAKVHEQRITEALPYTGKVSRIDFTKDPQYMDLLQKGLQTKTPSTTPCKYSPPSSTKTSTPPSTGSDLSRVSSPSLSANNSGSDSDEKERSKLSPQTKAPAIPAKQPVVSIQLPRSTAAITSTLSKDAAVKKPTPAPALPKVVAPVVKTVESKPANAAKAPDPKKPGLLAKFGFKKEEAQPAKTPAVVATATKPGMSKAH